MTATSSWRDQVVGMIPALRAFAWSLSHNGSDADDLVQDTLIKALSNRDKVEPGTSGRGSGIVGYNVQSAVDADFTT